MAKFYLTVFHLPPLKRKPTETKTNDFGKCLGFLHTVYGPVTFGLKVSTFIPLRCVSATKTWAMFGQIFQS